MANMEKYDIFISYRRVDSEGRTSGRDIARTIKLEFEKRGYKVFFDYSELKDNEFEDIILPAIRGSKVLFIILSKDSLIRCTNEGDWVRREIITAIESRVKIIPINPDNAFDGWPKNLPKELEPIKLQQFSDINMGSLFEKSIEKLIEDRLFPPSTAFSQPDNIENKDFTWRNYMISKWAGLANDLYKKGDYANAVKSWEKAIEFGDNTALYDLGYCYEKGLGINQDYTKAVELYIKSAEHNNPNAQNYLGILYKNGKYVYQNDTKAVEWFTKAAELGLYQAQYNLGYCYKYGECVPQNKSKAFFWFKKAAEQGFSKAQYELGHCYEYGEGVPKDENLAIKWYEDAAKQGHAKAQFSLGYCYYFGKGVHQNVVKAIEFYTKAAEQGYVMAQIYLGSIYRYELGFAKDYEKAKYWYSKAAQQGNEMALKELDKMKE